MKIRSLAGRIAGDKIMGAIDYFLFPILKEGCGGPFNGQQFRQQMFLELIRQIGFSAVVETGTFRGTTTEYMLEHSRLPVYTVELSPRYYGYAKTRLFRYRKVRVSCGDSRRFLRRIAKDPKLIGKQIFFYLDAHWGEDLPLRDEVQIICDNWPHAVVMIDDFKVPGDEEYCYDDYGDDKLLSLEYLAPLIGQFELSVFFPSRSARFESGGKHGCAVIAKSSEIVRKIHGMATLVPHTINAECPRCD